MSYIDKNLQPNEKVIHRAKLHWIIFVKPVLVVLLGALLIGDEDPGLSGFGMWVLVIGLFYLLSISITFISSEFGVTDRRVIAKVGFVRRNSLETLLTKVEGINVDQGIIGRILNYGKIDVRGQGGSSKPIPMIAKPMALRSEIYEQIETREGRARSA